MLASRSPQRKAILEQLGIRFQVVAPDVEEVVEGDPRAVVVENALRKARAVEGERILAADTAVVIEGRARGKPSGAAQARDWLERLQGREHQVWGGIAMRSSAGERASAAMTRVWFRQLEPSEVDWYLATGEWRERAGAYAIQGRGAALIDRVDGDFWNVVGLPVRELTRIAPDLIVDSIRP